MAEIKEIRGALISIEFDRPMGLVRSEIELGLPAKDILPAGPDARPADLAFPPSPLSNP